MRAYSMSDKYKANAPNEIHFITMAIVQWADVFTRREYCEIVCDSLSYCQKSKDLTLYAWCIMTNHLHLICSAPTLPAVVRDFKKYTAKELYKSIRENPQESRKGWLLWLMKSAGELSSKHEIYKLWQEGYHPVLLYNNQLMEQKLDYLHGNPVKAGFVSEPEQWNYSSAIDYAGGKGRLEIAYIQ
ncbi:transposase [Pontibacter sp. E15-1]|uniref:REP-associated tyrosine transposase n=1 Tax=Pontibacter sp. E15-1 TaxID=2919918 RepID=UPI001F50233D|nr:transposase [Pontibacter sp. E15-1]MCJ8165186.1 transposase [Pontibacter sp. E15-1]